MSDRGSHNPSGSFADFTTAPINRVKGHCERCGAGLDKKGRKRFCLPCYDIRSQENIARNRLKYKLARTP